MIQPTALNSSTPASLFAPSPAPVADGAGFVLPDLPAEALPVSGQAPAPTGKPLPFATATSGATVMPLPQSDGADRPPVATFLPVPMPTGSALTPMALPTIASVTHVLLAVPPARPEAPDIGASTPAPTSQTLPPAVCPADPVRIAAPRAPAKNDARDTPAAPSEPDTPRASALALTTTHAPAASAAALPVPGSIPSDPLSATSQQERTSAEPRREEPMVAPAPLAVAAPPGRPETPERQFAVANDPTRDPRSQTLPDSSANSDPTIDRMPVSPVAMRRGELRHALPVSAPTAGDAAAGPLPEMAGAVQDGSASDPAIPTGLAAPEQPPEGTSVTLPPAAALLPNTAPLPEAFAATPPRADAAPGAARPDPILRGAGVTPALQGGRAVVSPTGTRSPVAERDMPETGSDPSATPLDGRLPPALPAASDVSAPVPTVPTAAAPGMDRALSVATAAAPGMDRALSVATAAVASVAREASPLVAPASLPAATVPTSAEPLSGTSNSMIAGDGPMPNTGLPPTPPARAAMPAAPANSTPAVSGAASLPSAEPVPAQPSPPAAPAADRPAPSPAAAPIDRTAPPPTASAPVLTAAVAAPAPAASAPGGRPVQPDGSSADRVRPESVPTRVALPASVPPPLVAGTTAPAFRLFAAAIHAARSDERDPTPTAAAAAAAIAQPAPVQAAPAIADAQGSALDMADRRWPHAMVARIESLRDAASAAKDAASTSIRLVPDALGTIDVNVRTDGDTVHVHFAAEQAATRTMLADAQPRLLEIAEARGLKLGGADVGAGGQERREPAQPVPTAPDASQPSRSTPSDEDAATPLTMRVA